MQSDYLLTDMKYRIIVLTTLSALLLTTATTAQQNRGNETSNSANQVGVPTQFRFEVLPVNVTGPANNRVKLAYAAEGYTESDMATFPGHVKTAVDYLKSGTLSTRPYSRYFNFLNIYMIKLVSEESGVSEAKSFGQPFTKEVKNSIGGAKDEDRLGWVDGKKAEDFFKQAAASIDIDQVDWKYAILNNAGYHNSGGRHVVFSYNFGREIALHEAGHGHHNLADEYYGKGIYTRREPREVNVTADSTGAKWKHWIGYVDADTILGVTGVYEGAVYVAEGAYRPTPNSKMGWTSDRKPASFNAVSREKIILDIYDLVRPLDSFSDTIITHTNPEKLWVKPIDSEVIKVDWYVNGKLVAENGGDTILLNQIGTNPGTYSVRAHAYDEAIKYAFSDNNNPHPLDLVRRDLHKLQQEITWIVEVTRPALQKEKTP